MFQMQDDFYCQDCFASFFLFERDILEVLFHLLFLLGFFLDFEDTKQSFFFALIQIRVLVMF